MEWRNALGHGTCTATPEGTREVIVREAYLLPAGAYENPGGQDT